MQQKDCAVCGDPVSPAGRKSSSGTYYCSKIDCRRERDRLRAQRWRERHAPPPVPVMGALRVSLEIHDPERLRQKDELYELERLRHALLQGGLTQEEIDEQFPLPV